MEANVELTLIEACTAARSEGWARMPGAPSAGTRRVVQREPEGEVVVGEYTRRDGVRMQKVRVGFGRFVHREVRT